MAEGRKYQTGDEQRYRVNAIDGEERRRMAELDHHRRLADRRAASLEREIFRSTTRDLRTADEQPEPPATLCIDLSDMDLSDDRDLDENGLF